MGKSRVRLLRTIPGARNLAPIVRAFCARGAGIVTALDDGYLPNLRSWIPEDSEIEVLSFGSLVQSLLARCGEMPASLAQSGYYVAAIASACERLEGDSPFYASRHFSGLHDAVADTLKQLQAWNLDSAKLRLIAPQLRPDLAKKAVDLAQIDESAVSTLQQLGRQVHANQVKQCLEARFEEGESVGRVLIVAGAEATPISLDIVQWLATSKCDVSYLVFRGPTEGNLFHQVEHLATALGWESKDAGESDRLLEALFTERVASSPMPRVQISSSADALAESEWALRACLKANEAGMPYEAMGICTRDLETYAPLLESAAKRFKVPLCMTRRAPLLTNAFARLTLAILEACASHDVRRLVPVVKSSYLALSHDQQIQVQEALKEAYRTRAGQWQHLETWAATHEIDCPWLGKILAWRRESEGPAVPLGQWIDHLRGLIDLIPWADTMPMGRARDLRAQTAMQRALANQASVHRVNDAPPLTLTQFVPLARVTWTDADVSVPSGISGVTVSADAKRLPECRHVQVLGMLEGVFPKRRSEGPILSDEDLKDLSEAAGLAFPLSNSQTRAKAERDEFFTLCACASEEVFLSYPETGEDRDNVPAFYLKEIERACGDLIEKVSHSRTELVPPEGEIVSPFDEGLAFALKAPREDPLAIEPAEESSFSEASSFTPAELRDALLCSFRHFARHQLHLRPAFAGSRWSILRRLPGATSLIRQVTPEGAHQALTVGLESEIERLYPELSAWEETLLRSGGKRMIAEWVHREFLARNIWPKQEGSSVSHIKFGSDHLRSDLRKGISVEGTVAGVSKVGDYSVVHLFESRIPEVSVSRDFKLEDSDALFYGIHLMAASPFGKGAAVEVESLAGERSLLLMPRLPGQALPSQVQHGLRVTDLGSRDDPLDSKMDFYDRIKVLLDRSISKIRSHTITPEPGEHCSWCEFGELCRRSQEYSEDPQPFGGGFELERK